MEPNEKPEDTRGQLLQMKVDMNHRAAMRGQDEWFIGLQVESHTDMQLIIRPVSFLYCMRLEEKPQHLDFGGFFLLRLKVSMFSDVFTQFYGSSVLGDQLQ